MCDCYYHKCDLCDKEIYMHIGWGVPRKTIHVVCDWCCRKKANSRYIKNLSKMAYVKTETVRRAKIIRENGSDIGQPEKHRIVLIACEDADAYGVSLNQ